jgi:hypothetical protein
VLQITHQEHKKSAGLHQAAEVPWRFFVREIPLPHIDPVGQGTLPSPTTGCRVRFPESLLMLGLETNEERRSVKRRAK